MLGSAMNGGQWSQARKAQVPSFETTSSLCQLCLQEVGTLQHRARCKATLPAEGWPKPPEGARLARSKLQPRFLTPERCLLSGWQQHLTEGMGVSSG